MLLKYKSPESNPQFQDSFSAMYPEFTTNKGMVTKNITFVTTEDCNLACTYCYECSKTKGMMSIEVAKNAIDMLFDKEKINGYITDDNVCAIIEFIGGEPFMNIEVMEFVCEYFLFKAYELNHPWYKYHMFSVTTNGVLFRTPRVQRWLHKYKNRMSVSITIDGDKELHDACRVFHNGKGSYDVVVESVKDAIANFGLTSTKVTIAPENLEKMNTAIPHLFELGLRDISANCVYENVWEDKHAPILFRELVSLADYIIDNKKYKEGYISFFDKSIGKPMSPEENNNWWIRQYSLNCRES